jgi:hypothetical protein
MSAVNFIDITVLVFTGSSADERGDVSGGPIGTFINRRLIRVIRSQFDARRPFSFDGFADLRFRCLPSQLLALKKERPSLPWSWSYWFAGAFGSVTMRPSVDRNSVSSLE